MRFENQKPHEDFSISISITMRTHDHDLSPTFKARSFSWAQRNKKLRRHNRKSTHVMPNTGKKTSGTKANEHGNGVTVRSPVVIKLVNSANYAQHGNEKNSPPFFVFWGLRHEHIGIMWMVSRHSHKYCTCYGSTVTVSSGLRRANIHDFIFRGF